MTLTTSAGDTTVDLTTCDLEPIHQLGRVQSYGALMAFSRDMICQHASINLIDVAGVAHAKAVGQPIAGLFVVDAVETIASATARLGPPDATVRLFNIVLIAGRGPSDLSVHQSGDLIVVEIEPAVQALRSTDVMSEVFPHINRIEMHDDLAGLARDGARALRQISGFDSIMVYQFQPDASGRVIAEDRADLSRRYLGLNFPASDIPVQARALYARSLLRLIADVNDPGVPVLPGITRAAQPLDLSMSVTRAVSPIHIEYLRNMGVQASMSVSIMRYGKLWGLFACHHDTPRYVDYQTRTAIEMYAHLFSYELTRLEEATRTYTKDHMQRVQTRMMSHLADHKSLTDSLIDVSYDLARVVAHDGLVIYNDQKLHMTGDVPTHADFMTLVAALDGNTGADIIVTDSLHASFPVSDDMRQRCAGLIAIPISRRPRDYVVLFRKPVLAIQKWAGNPEKPVQVGPNGVRLTPRESFDAWSETVADRCAPWSSQDVLAATMLRTIMLEIFLKITDAVSEERKRGQEQQQLLISELNHRVRNILNLMRGLIGQTEDSATSVLDFRQRLEGRIQSLARAHDLLTKDQWAPSPIKDLIRLEFEAYASDRQDRVQLSGPDVMIAPTAHTVLALVLHEMATNAVKYGALSNTVGRVELTLSLDANGGLNILWSEKAGPPVMAPTRRGFGTTIITKSVPHELQGDASISYHVTGVMASFRIPSKFISRGTAQVAEAVPDPVAATAADPAIIVGAKVLVVEDSLIIALDAEGTLQDMGAAEVLIAANVTSALALLDQHEFAFALLDVNLGDEQSLPVAEALHARGTPFVLATGYGGSAEIAATYPLCPVLQKPYGHHELEAAIARLAYAR